MSLKPVLVMRGDRDAVVPQALGRRLYEAATAVKEGFWPRGVGHGDLFDRGGFETAVDFIARTVGQDRSHAR